VSEPVRDTTEVTKGGYWLVKVLEKDDNRTIDDADRVLLKSKAIGDWLTAMVKDPANRIESRLDDNKKLFAVEQLVKEMEL
jgi:hypothetical protein